MLGRSLSYTGKDFLAITEEITKYMTEFLPEITDASQANPGRLLANLFGGIIDVLNYSTDINFIESLWGVSQQRKNLINQAKGIPWAYPGPSAASTDLNFTQIGSITQIPRYLVCTTNDSPPKKFVTIDSGTVVSGSVTVAAVEGERVVEEILTSSASGALNQTYSLSQTLAPYQFVSVLVGGIPWTKQSLTLFESAADDTHFICIPDPDDPNITQVRFGNNEFGLSPAAGSQITVSYIRSSGESGNVPRNSITKIVGPINGSFTVNNPEGAGGGSDGPDVETIRGQAPWIAQTFYRAVNEQDYLAYAVSIPGVFDAAIATIVGSIYSLYIVPDGGGRASNTLIDAVTTGLDQIKMIGSQVTVAPTEIADLLIAAKIYTRTTDIPRATVRQKVIDAILSALDYRNIEIGEAFKVGELSKIILDIDNGQLVQAVNFSQLTRIPRVVQSDVSAPSMQGAVEVNATAGYNDWIVSQLSSTTFAVAKDGAVVGSPGNVGEEYTTSGGEITFTLGTPTETLPSSSVWSFSTSKYSGNIKVGTGEVPIILNLGQVQVDVFYPGEGTPFE